MSHDGDDARAGPWLFEVFLRLGKNDKADWVYETMYAIDPEKAKQLKDIVR